MRTDWATQRPYGVRLEWGLAGATTLAAECVAIVVVDVLSFTTAVSVAVDAGMAVLPYPWRDSAADFAREAGAELAVGRSSVSLEQPWSLSPAALRRAPAAKRLVLPSPNGSAISSAVDGIPVVASCLRNASSVGSWILEQGWGTVESPIAVIAAGEHWPGGQLRPAIEDWFGAAAVIAALAQGGADSLSPEALSACASYQGISDLPALIRESSSARELSSHGFGADVDIALELDASRSVPALLEGAFVDQRSHTDSSSSCAGPGPAVRGRE
ncbi:hypothetical protein D5S18_27560 [Nocardia panacis]|uniref:Probable 2-phosphosulfolactate phosphatase n=1 Tax=Nocardia panacis TaxID=2340916 RepID=A0A3A4KDI7_9NOCA|nr:2-phosphosulfolactate phosphatase [Nocardia panacis]RJO70935.1 hypothetical protein D5S18_27560 [Nocardia panacis]